MQTLTKAKQRICQFCWNSWNFLEHLNWNNQSFQVVDSDISRFSTTKKHGQIEPGHFQYNFLSSHLAMFTRFEKLWSRLLATVWQFFSRKLWFYIVGKLIMWLSRGASQKKKKSVLNWLLFWIFPVHCGTGIHWTSYLCHTTSQAIF